MLAAHNNTTTALPAASRLMRAFTEQWDQVQGGGGVGGLFSRRNSQVGAIG